MIYLNNKLVPDSRAMVSVFDHGFLYGDGIYETLRAYKETVFMLEEHMERLFSSAEMIRLEINKTPAMIKKAVYETLKANKHKDAYIRITVSRGAGPIGLDPALCKKPTFIIMSRPFTGYPLSYYKKGLKIAVVNTRRNYHKALDPAIKSLNFLNNILAKIEAKEKDAYEAIMLNHRGYIAEGTISNIFFVKEGALCTPAMSVGILGGITRKIILESAAEVGVRVKEGSFRPADLYGSDEVFISNTTMEAMPVSHVDGKKVTNVPGSITKELRKAYRKKVKAYLGGSGER